MSVVSTSIISAQNLSFAYDHQVVLENVSFEVSAGAFVGIIGPNGSGKTTLIKILLGILQPQAGSLTIFDKPVVLGHHGREIAYVPQKVTQAENRFPITVEEVVALGRLGHQSLFHRSTATDDSINRALETVGLTEVKTKQLSALSGGQQQRVFIAKALAAEPKLLILDEPTVGIDSDSQDRFYALLSQLNRKHGLTIILVSHDIEVVVKEVTSVLCLNKTLIYHGNPHKFSKSDYLEKLYGEHRRYIIHGH